MSRLPLLSREDELLLLRDTLAGDRDAADRFVARYDALVEYCVRRTLRRAGRLLVEDDVRDLVADVWVSLLEDDMRRLRRFEPGRDIRVSTWIGRLARNRVIDVLRARRVRALPAAPESEIQGAPCPAPLPPEAVARRQERDLARKAMAQLRPDERRFLRAWYVDGRAPADLARELGVALTTVYTRRFKVQQKLARSVRRLTRPDRAALRPRVASG